VQDNAAKLAINPRQIEHRCNRTHLVIVRHNLLKAERIKQLRLILLQPTHHGPFPPPTASTSGNHCSRKPSTDFCNKICQKSTSNEKGRAFLLDAPPNLLNQLVGSILYRPRAALQLPRLRVATTDL
jgi:hypothetical protein